jgi:hypothetical protein
MYHKMPFIWADLLVLSRDMATRLTVNHRFAGVDGAGFRSHPQ